MTLFVKHPNKLRPYWLLGRTLELIRGDDDKVRSVKLKRGDGKIVIDSLKHLYPLELSLTHNVKFSSCGNKVNRDFQDVSDHSAVIEAEDSDQKVQDDVDSCSEHDLVHENLSSRSSNHSAVVEPENNFSNINKRKAALACTNKIKKWCNILSQ